MTRSAKRVLIIGGVAGGASCATRLRRLDESCHITMIDRGPFVSFAVCGLPYRVGDVIADEDKLPVATPRLCHDRFARRRDLSLSQRGSNAANGRRGHYRCRAFL